MTTKAAIKKPVLILGSNMTATGTDPIESCVPVIPKRTRME